MLEQVLLVWSLLVNHGRAGLCRPKLDRLSLLGRGPLDPGRNATSQLFFLVEPPMLFTQGIAPTRNFDLCSSRDVSSQ